MSTRYFEDIRLHEAYRSRAYLLTEKEIIDFASEWDPQPFHTDPDYAKNTRIKGLFASGIHLLAISVKLYNETVPSMALIAGMGWDEISFVAPARPGDTLVFEGEAISKRNSESDAGVGIARYILKLIGQDNNPVITFKGTILVQKRNRSQA
ncbi:MAG: MaoC/PaaZ C-terminal domain-containing protein [Dehalococcoidia bacterium]